MWVKAEPFSYGRDFYEYVHHFRKIQSLEEEPVKTGSSSVRTVIVQSAGKMIRIVSPSGD
jgi:hypothetical protein